MASRRFCLAIAEVGAEGEIDDVSRFTFHVSPAGVRIDDRDTAVVRIGIPRLRLGMTAENQRQET